MCKRQLDFYGLQQLLSQNVVELKFRKVNGDVVVRKATRNMEKIESVAGDQSFSGTSFNQYNRVRFFDLDDEQWKSAYPDRVLNHTILERLT